MLLVHLYGCAITPNSGRVSRQIQLKIQRAEKMKSSCRSHKWQTSTSDLQKTILFLFFVLLFCFADPPPLRIFSHHLSSHTCVQRRPFLSRFPEMLDLHRTDMYSNISYQLRCNRHGVEVVEDEELSLWEVPLFVEPLAKVISHQNSDSNLLSLSSRQKIDSNFE